MCSLASRGSFSPAAVDAAVEAVNGEKVDVLGAVVIVAFKLELRETDELAEADELREAEEFTEADEL